MGAAQHGAGGVIQLIALHHHATTAAHRVSAGLGAAVLAAIQRPQIGQLAPAELVVQTHVGGVVGIWPQEHGLVLKECLVRRSATLEHLLRVGVLTVLVVGVVVDHLVVIPHQHPGVRGMRRLQHRVTFVLFVAVAVLRQCFGLFALVLAKRVLRVAALVDVVAHEQHKVEGLFGNVCMRDELALLVMLAGRQRDTQLLHVRVRGGCCARVAHGAEGDA